MIQEKKERKCSYLMNNKKPCGKPVHDSGLCIFHSMDIERKRESFEERFWEEFERQRREESEFDFRGYIFPNPINFSEKELMENIHFSDAKFDEVDFTSTIFRGNANFKHAQFKGKANFRYTNFSGKAQFGGTKFFAKVDFRRAQFSGEVNFTEAVFLRDVVYYSTTFHKGVNFTDATFSCEAEFRKIVLNGEAYFNKAAFERKANFDNGVFSGYSDFSNTYFSERAEFRDTEFVGGVTFCGATFTGKIDFSYTAPGDFNISNATFSGEAIFRQAEFSGDVNFSNIIFSRKADFGFVTFGKEEEPMGKIDFSNTKFGKDTDFFSAEFFSDITDFSKARFLGEESNFEKTKFSSRHVDLRGTRFEVENTYFNDAEFDIKKTKKIFLDDAYFNNVYGLFELLERKKKYLLKFTKTEYLNDGFKFNLVGSESLSRYPIVVRMIEDAWYFDRLEKIKPLTYHFLLRTTNLYKSIRRYILCCAVIALFFGGIYHLAFFLNSQSFHFDPQLEHQSFFSFFYYSVVTFTTLGFGDIVPLKGWLQALVIAEVTCGYIMLGFLISLISNYLLSRRNRM